MASGAAASSSPPAAAPEKPFPAPPQPVAPPAPAAPDSRPYPQRLTEERCGRCHGVERYAPTLRTRLGWEWTVTRMQLVNGAVLASGERPVIVGYLSETYGAPLAQAVAEWAALALLAALPAAWWLVRQRRRSFLYKA
ncbi:hypothetical protein FR698_16120 [Pelomicrobium methylotrophicum]|uniref:Quinohemoprotein amine dehydrogenase alpha subunit haem binding domain-containing protein n=1 Tax=Pelomicrobium methylotrophicum TaxID=2602750 RepID=A0A5C7ER31_9PROT|nr:hypothetical protein FR698_16120 [Pelomicrobium methylotrophicum]